MRRRTVLRRAGVLGALGVAGCTAAPSDDGGGGGGNDGEADPTDTASPTRSPTDVHTPRPTDTDTPVGSEGSPMDPEDETQTGTPSETPESSPTPATPGGVEDRSFTVEGSSCGGQADAASISFDAPSDAVTVTGTIWGSDACQTAELASLELSADTLTVRVREATEDEDSACAQCIVEIDYEVTVALDDGLPDRVVVTHDHGDGATEVASVSR